MVGYIMFIHKLNAAAKNNNSLVCVGLDPLLERLPKHLIKDPNPLFCFNKGIIDATADLVCAYKPQIAYYHAAVAEDQLTMTIEYLKSYYPHIPVILDAKRGDISSTAIEYAKEAFVRYQADAVTVNPYMGLDAIKPFTDYKDKGVFVLCRTSNPSACAIQNLPVGDRLLYEVIATTAITEWNQNNNISLVVGATSPDELKKVRQLVGDTTLLIPGLGAQGGDVQQTVTSGINHYGLGIIANSSRSIIYASQETNYTEAARKKTQELQESINQYL